VEALRSEAEMRTATGRFAGRAPLLANMVEGGKTPVKPTAELESLGFSIAIFPGGTVRALARSLAEYYASLRQHGTTAPFRDRMLDFGELQQRLGTAGMLELGRKYDA
jgi:2-methylisocitrate lyase-like PEP mutase family enzyme